MKVALIGNMNNNHFALMRYLHDLGIEAHLFLYNNDGKSSSEHFKPENDTWEIEKWKPFIHETKITNGVLNSINFSVDLFVMAFFYIRNIFTKTKNINSKIVTEKYIRSLFVGFDFIIGNGAAPAILARAKINLDIFIPYAIGIEGLGDPTLDIKLKKSTWLMKLLISKARNKQELALRKVPIIAVSDSISIEELVKRNINYHKLLMPIVYNLEKSTTEADDNLLRDVFQKINDSNFTVFSHASHSWSAKDEIRAKYSKHNDWLIYGFAELVLKRPELNPLLILVEYGMDVKESKDLISLLNIQKNVVWLPTLKRRQIMKILPKVNIGVGEFVNIQKMFWGGTGWEVLSSGIPLLQSFNFKDDEFIEDFCCPPPPLLKVRRKEDISSQLIYYSSKLDELQKIGLKSKSWFDQYNGIGLAKHYVELLKQKAN